MTCIQFIFAILFLHPAEPLLSPLAHGTKAEQQSSRDTLLQITLDTYSLPTCSDTLYGSIGVQVNGGMPPYHYLWSTGDTTPYISQLAVGTYFLTVTDASGDSISWSFTLWNKQQVEINGVYVIPESCPGACDAIVEIDASGGQQPYVYTISGDSCTGLQTILVTDANGCTATESVFIWSEEGPEIIDILITSPTPGIHDGVIEVLAFGMDPLFYSIDGITFQASPVFSGLSAGPYCVWIKDISDCVTKSDSLYLGELTSLPHISDHLTVFPNPAGARLHIASATPAAVMMWNDLGQQLRSSPWNEVHDMPVDDLPRGSYWLQIFTSGSVDFRRVILQ